jgi:predicted kinase
MECVKYPDTESSKPPDKLYTIRTETITLLKKYIKTIKRNIKERHAWLQANPGGSEVKPKFSNTYTKRSLCSSFTRDDKRDQRLAKIEEIIERRALSPASKATIAALRTQKEERIEEEKQVLTEAFNYDLNNRPMYIGLSPADMKIVHEDFNTQVCKMEARMLRELAREIEVVVANDKTRNTVKNNQKALKDEQLPMSPMVVSIKEENARLYREFVDQLQQSQQKYLARFELLVEGYIKDGYSSADITHIRQENDKQMKKERDLKTKEFDVEVSRRTRLAQAELRDKEIKDDPVKSKRIAHLMEIYMLKVQQAKATSIATVTWEKAMKDIDMTFVQAQGDWNIFAGFLCDCWMALSLPDRKKEYDRLVRLYAVINKTNLIETCGDDDQMTQIRELRHRRNELLNAVCLLDTRIAHKIRKAPRVVAVTNSGARNNVAEIRYNAIITAAPRPVITTIPKRLGQMGPRISTNVIFNNIEADLKIYRNRDKAKSRNTICEQAKFSEVLSTHGVATSCTNIRDKQAMSKPTHTATLAGCTQCTAR